jgi:hypothetical protein
MPPLAGCWSAEWPTAQHSDALTHVTSKRVLMVESTSFGELTILHDSPSHRWINVSRLDPPHGPLLPTAQHSLADAHVTADSSLVSDVCVLGESTIVHVSPSQRSTRVCQFTPVVSSRPTAQHCDGDTHETPDRW